LMAEGRLVALDTPGGLKKRHVPGDLFRVAEVDRRAAACLRALPGVHGVKAFGSGFHVRSEAGRLAVDSLIEKLRAAGFPGAVAEVMEASLEDVFLEVVGSNAVPAEKRS